MAIGAASRSDIFAYPCLFGQQPIVILVSTTKARNHVQFRVSI